MENLPLNIQKSIRRFEPIETEGLTLHPICVSEYSNFVVAKAAIEFMQRSLPVTLLSKPLLQAFYTLELEAMQKNESSPGLMYRAALFLVLALKIGEGKPMQDRIAMTNFVTHPQDETRLLHIEFNDGERIVKVTPIAFQIIRPILAAQNGIELLSDDANPELVEAERDLAEMNAPKIKFSLEALKASLALFSGEDEVEMEEWPILKLMKRSDAYTRFCGYLLCGMAESQGAKWKGGNPYPSPIFEKKTNISNGVISMDSFAGGAGMRAMENAGQKTF